MVGTWPDVNVNSNFIPVVFPGPFARKNAGRSRAVAFIQMKILQKYVTVNLVTVTLIALFGLVSLFAFFSIIDELADTVSEGGLKESFLMGANNTLE